MTLEELKAKAEQGDAAAQNDLGKKYHDGDGVEKDAAQACEWFRKAAMQGYAPAQYNLGICYADGDGVEKDSAQACEWCRKAAEQGYAPAQFQLGIYYAVGRGVEWETAQAVGWYLKAAEQGYAPAQFQLGFCYECGNAVNKDEAQAIDWYLKAAEQGYKQAQYHLAFCYENGRCVEKDTAKALFWQLMMSTQKSKDAQAWFGVRDSNGWGEEKDMAQTLFRFGLARLTGQGVEQDDSEAVFWLRKADEPGKVSAQYQLGICYDKGHGVEQDAEKAVFWYRKAAEQGHAAAQCNLGVCYFSGRGVERSAALAVYWTKKAALQGDSIAQHNFGTYYEAGFGVEQDDGQAADWYRKAAEQGHVRSHYRLGLCYYEGRGVEQDYGKAAELFEKAAANKLPEAQYFLGECYYYGYGVEQDYGQAFCLYQAAEQQGNISARCRLLDMAARGLLPEAGTVWIDAAADEGYAEAQIVREDRSAAAEAERERQQAEAEQTFEIANALQKHHVFLSWNHNDGAFKDRLVKGIEEYDFYRPSAQDKVFLHFRTWESDRDGEGEIETCVRNAIECSKCFIALISVHSLESKWMRKEIECALEKVKRGEWQTEDLIVVYLDGAASEAVAALADKEDPFVRLNGIAAKFPNATNAERTVENVCGQIKNCLERKTCERFLRETREECSVYKSTIYGQISGQDQRLLKGRFSMDGAYLPPVLTDESGGQVSAQTVMQTPRSFWLYGAIGVGKSLFVRYLIKNYMGEGWIFLRLDLADGALPSAIPQAESLTVLLNGQINRYAEDDAGKSEGAFARLEKGNKIFIILDGMDELDGDGREKLKNLTEAHLKRFPAHKFIFVSRSRERMSEFNFDGTMQCYRLDGFCRSGDAMRLYDAIVKENGNYLASLGAEKTNTLREHFSGRVSGLPDSVKENPLILSNLILIWLQSDGKDFPTKKYEILKKSAEIFMGSIAASSERADASIRRYLRGNEAETLFKAIAYRRLCGVSEDSRKLLSEFLRKQQKSEGEAEEIAEKLDGFLRRRKIFDGKTIYHDVFTAYFAGSYLYRKIYTEREIGRRDRRIAFCSGSAGAEQVGKKRLKTELRGGGSDLFTETAVDLVLMLDSKTYFYCKAAAMDSRHPSYPVFSRTLKMIRKRLPQVRRALLDAAREEETLWYDDFVRARLGSGH